MAHEIIDGRQRDLGGLTVARVLPAPARQMVGPFIFFDHLGPAQIAPGTPRSLDVRPHPHIGLATVTYLLAGEITHRDSVGSEVVILPGELNWMTSGRGITHSERFEGLRSRGGRLHGLQSWVALPREHEEVAPAFTHHTSAELPGWSEGGVQGRLLAGRAFGLRSPAPTHSPLFYLHWQLAPGARCALPADATERAIYVVSGEVECAGLRVGPGRLLVLGAGAVGDLSASTAAVVMALGGEPLGPRFIDWNFVSSSRERIAAARADWQAGRFAPPVGDATERIPLPESGA